MGSSSSGKKHKKDKKHRHRDEEYDEYSADEAARRHKHKEAQREKSRHRHREDRDAGRLEVINVPESDSDSSDCVEVPVEPAKAQTSSEREISAPPPPVLSKSSEYERERLRKERGEREKIREREKERQRLREYERAKEKERDRVREKERERERYEREREMERRRERDMARERERDRDRENRERHQRERGGGGGGAERERDRRDDRERHTPRDRSASPIPENGAGDCLSIEETNKLRAKLGLKPLEMDSGASKPSTSAAASTSTAPGEKDLSSYKDEWGEFLHKPADNIKDKKEAEKLRDKLKQRKEKRFLEERLARIRTLGESDDEVDDISKWVERNKRTVDEKKQAAMRAKVLEEMDAEFGVDDLVEKEKEERRRKAYSDKSLKGLRVEHDMEDFTEGKTIILTLKDKDVLNEEDGDALVNVNMMDDERYRKNVDNKKKNPLSYGYNVYEEQYDELGNPIERNILEKYDEDIDGKPTKKRAFVIGENSEEQKEHQRKLLEIKTKLAGKRLETLADIKIQLASDTLSEAEIAKFKKPKKKVKKIRQKLRAEDLLPIANEPSEQHLGSRQRPPADEDVDMAEESKTDVKLEEEDDDLERMLSKARRIKQQENIIKKPLPINMDEIKTEVKVEQADESDSNEEAIGADGNIILNATAEFCRTLGDIPTYGMAGNRNVDSNEMMDFVESAERDDAIVHHIDGDSDEAQALHGTWNSVNPEDAMRPIDFDAIVEEVEDVAILDEEPDVGAGVANALRLALSKGYLEKEEHNRPSNSKMAHLQAKNYSIDDKATGEDEKFGRRERFYTGPLMDFKDKDTFKPNVKLEYIDDNGRILNLKEAFRYLSHKFHGKGPGKNKIEKRLKKMEQDGLMKTMSSTDTPLGTLTMLQQKQRETKTPYVVLSGGKQNINTPTSISKYK